ncbi:hypothetical protein KIN20_001523 [Parelaphostrongylus tenuis]|uniref:SAP domain-containing protein n=1 Tax=Parelaphostrongylus tenuis TaxID=148309 RepID=A0AAD5LTT3_PARTN|nr:hypothetical protein KIN20_001523 [Parelaphostrongylus tenuis]
MQGSVKLVFYLLEDFEQQIGNFSKMSQFGGGKPGGWTRPGTGGSQMAGFGMGVGAFPMMGVQSMGVPMGMVNQAAFAQQNVMGMGVMGAVPSSASVRASGQSNSSVTGKNQRTFVGVVTKMHDNYGFVDDDVFFQHSVIRGTLPRVGEKVMVEASYNPQMPFKWNAYRIQLLNSGDSGPPSQNHNMARSGGGGGSGGGRWGPPSSGDRNGPSHRGSPPRRRSPPRRSPRHAPSPARKDGAQRRKSPPIRRSPPARRSSPPSKSEKNERDRKRERSANPSSAAQSTRKDSASPPRRRARIIPRYECRPPRPVPLSEFMSVVGLRTRYAKLYIPSDFSDMTAEWTRRVPLDADIDLTNPVAFHVWNKEVDYPLNDGLIETIIEPDDADHRHQVKVLLLAHGGRQEVHKKAFGLLPDGTTDDTYEPTSFFKQLSFLVGTRGKEPLAIGGSWSPSRDGDDPTSPTTIIRTAIRTTKALTGVDLSNVPQWYELVHVRYYRADRDRTDSVRLLLPDTQLLLDDNSDEERWTAVQAALQAQLETKLAAVDTPSPEVDQLTMADDAAKDKESRERTTRQDQSVVVSPTKEAASAAEDTSAKEGEEEIVESKEAPTHWSKLDLKTLKVPELRAELEARGLETKGVKSLLCKRLQEALDKEKEKEEGEGAAPTGDIEMTDVAGDEEEQEGKAEQASTEKKSVEKSEAELKKEAEEQKKKAEKLEKEKQERKATLEKYYAMPKERKILVYPSKTAKGGKFDCRVMNMQSLLDYRQDDNKESHFEVSLFVEAFKELLERHAAFTIYYAIARAADKEVERKRRDEAREKKDEETEEEKKEGEEMEEKKEEKKEKLDLKSMVSNRSLFESFAMFDVNLCGYLNERDLEDIIFNSEFGVTRAQMQKISHKLMSRERINYRHLTDVLVDSDGNVRFAPGECENPPEMSTLLKGCGLPASKSSLEPQINGEVHVSDASDGTVIINGNVVNVAQKLALLKRSEIERDQAKAALAEQTTLIDQLRDIKHELERKNRDIEKDFDKQKKRLDESNNALKSSLDSNISLKSALSDCKRYADRIMAAVERTCPPPPPIKQVEEVKPAVDGVDDTDEPIPAEIVLTEEVGAEEDNEEKAT